MENVYKLMTPMIHEHVSMQIDQRIRWLEAYYSANNKPQWLGALVAYKHTGATKLDPQLVIHLDNLVNTYGQQAFFKYLQDVYPSVFIKVS